MKKGFLILLTLFSLYLRADAQVFRPMASRYNNASVKGNIVYVANNSVTTPAAITTEAPPGGTATNNANPGAYLDIDVDVPAHTMKIPFGSVWNYHSNGAAPANNPALTDWKQPAYIMPAAWNAIGSAVPSIFILPPFPGKYGFSNPADASIITCIKSSAAITVCAPAAGAKYTAYYFRKTVNFTAPELAAFSTIQVNMKRNDGVVVYVNGVERLRTNMPGGVIGYGTLATAAIATGATENYTFNLNPAFFVAGINTIAVETHLNIATATNMSFDMQMLGIDNNSSFSSTSANLNLNSCSQVLWAGLYWGANHQSGVGADTAWIKQEDTVKLRVPGSSTYQIITSSQNDYHNSARLPGLNHAGYFCFAEITSLINLANANGTYTVADIVAPVGFNSCGAGWTIAIVYANPSEIQRNIAIFDGSAVVKVGSPNLFVPISGFLTPPVGPVSCELGVVAYDGDRGATLSDNFFFKQNSNPVIGAYTNLTPNATSNLNDLFNSTISNKGVVPGPASRNPAHNNTLGYDADIIEIPNSGNALLGNSQTSASIRLSSTVEDFFVQVLTTAISIYNPSFAFDKTAIDLSAGSLTPGDSLRYKMSYDNVGNDTSTNSQIIDNIPPGSTFKPGSIRIGNVYKTDAAGDDEAEYDFANNRIIYRLGLGANAVTGGEIAALAKDSVFFDVYVPSSCAILSCGGSLRNRARMSYGGKLSLLSLQDSSGVLNAGCIDPVDKTDIVTGTCTSIGDTILTNRCPALTVQLPIAKYAGYSFYTGIPFTPANRYNPANPVTFTRVMYAYYDATGVCLDDTTRINIFITGCPDIDDDDDGLPDYLELNDTTAIRDFDSDGRPNWADPTPGGGLVWVDNNLDGSNDYFDPGADADNDGTPNFYDINFLVDSVSFVDTNLDAVNDLLDKDLDGIPNYLDLDSDNDGIPDTVESFGVDVNGDGRIDNFSDSDNDGLSQNVDASGPGATFLYGSGIGLGAINIDSDSTIIGLTPSGRPMYVQLPNYLDLDSDNDGIPDINEALGNDTNNDGFADSFTDNDADGLSDNIDADQGNDGVAENIAIALLRTGPDGNGDGKADNYPFKNMDNDTWPNCYDLDSDMDGIVDVIEAGFTDANFNGFVDGAIGADGWNTALNALPAINIRNSDAFAGPDYLDIDADDDGIPDNIEGQTTAGYQFPTYLDTDNDGLDNRYDGTAGVGGSGIFVADKDLDTIPDYLDLDTDSDGQPDIVEGNDFNLNAIADDDVALTYLDTDGDGLDNKFDSLNSVTNIKGTSYRMGTGGSLVGDPAPGTRAPVQKRTVPQPERDWRYVTYVLPLQYLQLSGAENNNSITLNWGIITSAALDVFDIERSTDNRQYQNIATLPADVPFDVLKNFAGYDNIDGISSSIIYYRIKVTAKNGQVKYSNVIGIKKSGVKNLFTIQPNPAADITYVKFYADKEAEVTISIKDITGRLVHMQKVKAFKGNNSLPLNGLSKYNDGVYNVQVLINNDLLTSKLIIQN
jgi:uncharacterized repeat protein (TIGR01451 family)